MRFLRDQGHAFLADEMGLGKSAQLVQGSTGDTLVVAPAMVIDSGTWDNEIDRWAHDRGRFEQASYSSLTVREGRQVTDKLRPELNRPWDTLILDEAHYIKNPKAVRTKAIRQLAKMSDRVFLASGTPIPNWPHELFVPLQLLFPKKARPGGDLGSRWRWTDEWFQTRPSRYGGDFAYDVLGLRGCGPACRLRSPLDPCVHYHEFVRANLGDHFLQRLRDDVLTDLPPLTEQVVTLPMTPKQDREYASMAKEYIAQIGDEELIAWSASAKNTYLDKMTTGLGVADGRSTQNSNKFDQLTEDLSQRSRPILVAAHYRNTVEAARQIAEHDLGLRTAVIHGEVRPVDRKRVVDAFQNGQIDVLVGSLDTIAEGLTLTAADMLILIETSYKPSRNQQVKRRIHRLGQQHPCTVRDYVSVRRNGTPCLDGNKRELVASKTDTQTRTLSAARFKELL